MDRTSPWKLNEAGDSLIVIGDSSNFGRYIELISSNQLILLSAPVSVGNDTIQAKQFFNR